MARIEDQELVLHLFAHADGPARNEAAKLVWLVWEQCGDELAMTVPVPKLGLPVDSLMLLSVRGESRALAARQRVDVSGQAILRVEHDVLILSLMLRGGTWRSLVADLAESCGYVINAAATVGHVGLIGFAVLYLGEALPTDRQEPGFLAGLAEMLPGTQFQHGGELAGMAIWETTARIDARVARDFVLLSAPEQDRELSEWAWSWELPKLTRYLAHTAKLRYQLRVYQAHSGPAELCRMMDETVAGLATGGPAAVATLQAARLQAGQLLTALRGMRQNVLITRSAAAAALDGRAEGEPFADDEALGAHLLRRIEDDISFLETSDDGARRAVELAGTISVATTTGPTFGIVTALPEEFASVRAMLDNPRPDRRHGDRSAYVIGTMPSALPDQPHTVVVTMLGDTATNAAADATANLIRSYDMVNCVLMVGVAAGVPAPKTPAEHVRLGDIVVASWGIVDYDHVIDTLDGTTLRQPHPRPSPTLLHAAKLLGADEHLGLRPWEAILDHALATLPAFARPPASTDLVHADDDAHDVVPHPDPALSGHRPGVPRVHHGRIGSGDRSFRNLARRDELAARHGIRAFEMEGTGIGKAAFANGVEWYVIRGISDYGDRRTGPDWRPYAALAAAAYAKALLGMCPPLAPRGGHSIGG